MRRVFIWAAKDGRDGDAGDAIDGSHRDERRREGMDEDMKGQARWHRAIRNKRKRRPKGAASYGGVRK